MLEILVTVLAIVSFVVLLIATLKFYQNAKTIDSPTNVVSGLTRLEERLRRQEERQTSFEAKLLATNQRLYEDSFDRLHGDVNRLVETSIQVQKRLIEILGESAKSVSEIDSQITALRQYTAEQQGLLSRFQQGYDFTINKGLILGIIRAIETAEERAAELGDGDASAAIGEVKDNLLVTLEAQNVDEFEPPIGESYRDHMKSAQAQPQVTDEAGNVGKIAAVLKPGFIYAGVESEKVIRPATVSVYVSDAGEAKGVES